MKANKTVKKLIGVLMSVALVLGIMQFVPKRVYAAGSTVLYITDAIDGGTETVTVDREDIEGGWSYVAETSTLTLDGFNGEYIEADGDLNIVLKGTNTITIASDSECGIKTGGKLTIDDTTSPSTDSLDIICSEPKKKVYMILSGGTVEEKATYIYGGTVKLKGTTVKNSIYGIINSVYVNNDANLDIDISAGKSSAYVTGADLTLYQYTSGTVSVSVETMSDNCCSIYNLYQYGTGDINLTAKGKAKAIKNRFYQDSGCTGTVTVKGYLASFTPIKSTCTVEGYGNVLWSHYSTEPVNGYYDDYLCDSSGTPIKDPVIKYVENQPLTVMDSNIFDIPERTVGDVFRGNSTYWTQGCKGGNGSYTFSLAEDSDSLPEGVTVKSSGYFDGKPTAPHAAGTAKIKVTSGSDIGYLYIDYGEITYKNPITSMEIDKTEVSLNKKESTDITVTILPVNADNRNVNWKCSNALGTLNELTYDENSNIRTARFTADNRAGVIKVTAAALMGNYNKECTIYIKETKPAASAGNSFIEGLDAEEKYTVNGSKYIADSSGRIKISESWRETTISIVKTNEVAKCNSDAQELPVGKKTSIDIKTLGVVPDVEYNEISYDGYKKEPEVTISGLTKGTDYNVTYENNINAGKATVLINGINDYCGTIYRYFNITALSIEGHKAVLSATEYTYDKTEKKPDVSVEGLTKDTDYTVEYSDNISAGTAVVKILGKGNYCGQITETFTIKPISIDGAEFSITTTSFVYDGTAKTPIVSIAGLIKDIDYKVEYDNNINAGTAKAVVTGIGNYKGTVNKEFVITKADAMTITAKDYTGVYDRAAHTISFTGVPAGSVITYAASQTGTYSTNKVTRSDIGTTVVYYKITNPNYVKVASGSAKVSISISKITPVVTLSASNYTYDGKVKTPSVTVKDTKGRVLTNKKDYTVKYASGRTNIGKYCVTVTLKGNYYGSRSVYFNINPKGTTISKVLPMQGSFRAYWNKMATQTTGYQLQYSTSSAFTNPVTVGIAKNTTLAYTRTSLAKDKIYYVRVRTYKTVGTTKFYSAWSPAKTVTTTSIKNVSSYRLSASRYLYDGKVKTPSVVVKNYSGKTLVKGTDYTLTYSSGRKNVGKYAVKITFRGKYSGSKVLYFNIVPKATPITSIANTATGVTIKWSRNTTATGYVIYRSVKNGAYSKIATITANTTVAYTDKAATSNGVKYTYKIYPYKTVSKVNYYNTVASAKTTYRQVTPTVTASNDATKRITVKWNRNSSATGYKVRFYTGSTYKDYVVSGNTNITKVFTNLALNQTYKVYVASYKTVSGVNYYSGWSAAKTVKVVK